MADAASVTTIQAPTRWESITSSMSKHKTKIYMAISLIAIVGLLLGVAAGLGNGDIVKGFQENANGFILGAGIPVATAILGYAIFRSVGNCCLSLGASNSTNNHLPPPQRTNNT